MRSSLLRSIAGAAALLSIAAACSEADPPGGGEEAAPPAAAPVPAAPAPEGEVASVRQADSVGQIELTSIAEDADDGTYRWGGTLSPTWVGMTGCSAVGLRRNRYMNVKFDTSALATLPACATIDSATLRVAQTVSGGPAGTRAGSYTFTARRINTAWSESASVGACSGDSAFTVGSVRSLLTGLSVGSGVVPSTVAPTVQTYLNFGVTADVQGFRSSPSSNNGWSISFSGTQFPNCNIDPNTAAMYCAADLVNGCGGNRRNIGTREDLDPANHPKLYINYTLRDSGCNDGNPCTSNVCSPGGCTYPADPGGVCTDNRSCTTDACVSGSCVSTPVNTNCNDANLCTTDTCNPASGSANLTTGCLFTNNALACNDSRSCTINDVCGGGACNGTPSNGLCTDGNVCTTDTCNPASGSANAAGCVFTNNTIACDDGVFCTLPDTCSGGACVGTLANARCNDNTLCTTDTCNPASGSADANGCVITNNTLACSDGIACTLSDTCGGGTCSGTPTNAQCNDSNECTTDTCAPGGCTNVNRPDGTSCTWDSDVCHMSTCQGGQCNTPNVGAPCRAGSCSGAIPNAVAIAPAVCTAGGTCPSVVNLPCGATTPCNAANTACQGACAADGDCPSGFFCSGTTCQVELAQGGICDRNQMCANNRCRDGRCCNTTCGASNPDDCQSCANPAGTCELLTGTACQDGSACTTNDTCGAGTCVGGAAPNCNDNNVCTTDACDPATGCTNVPGGAGLQCRAAPGACDLPEQCTGSSATCPTNAFRPSGFSCRVASCTGGQETLAAVCTGSGAGCPRAVVQSCSPYVCGPSACVTSCTDTADCAAGFYCSGSSCVAQQPDGGSCTAAIQCASGFCTDGVCCDAACGGQCEACDVQGSVGECRAVTGVPVAPRQACDADGSVCSGSCNGTLRTACSYPGNATRCRNASCTNDVETLSAQCNGSGICPAVRTGSCSPFVCGATACVGACTSDTQCQAGLFCQAGSCTPLQEKGATCSRDSECESDICADGVCCDARCTGQCEACDLAGTAGTCTPVSGQPRSGRPGCVGDGSACQGVCGGSRDACVYPGPGVECRAAECSSGVATVASECQGTGTCPPPLRVTCPGDCVGTGCASDCSVDGDCGVQRFCLGGLCQQQRSNGEACNSPGECISSFCVDGTCCSSPCKGQCEACDVTGSEGECAPVAGPPHGARPQCAAGDPECAGACDGAARLACAYPGSSTTCEPADCAAGVATLERTCAGDGACGPRQQQLCAPFTCGASACNGDCNDDGDCAADEFCSGGVCKARLPFGSACAASSQCSSGFCVDRVCCNAACTGQCEACDSPATIGRCAPVVGQPHRSRPPCGGTAACAGQCDGAFTTACIFPSPATSCGEAICSGGVARGEPRCNGSGTCIAGSAQGCFPFSCLTGSSECRTACVTENDCASGLTCTAGLCEGTPLPEAGTDAATDAATDATTDAATDAAPGTGGAPGAGGALGAGGTSAAGGTDAGAAGSPAGGRPTAGTGGRSSGPPDAGAGPDAGNEAASAKDEGGCGCRVAGEDRPGSVPALLGLAALTLLAGRRGRRRSINRAA